MLVCKDTQLFIKQHEVSSQSKESSKSRKQDDSDRFIHSEDIFLVHQTETEKQ